MIALRDVQKIYRRGEDAVVALSVGDLSVERGEHVAVVGPSGCGKTTLLHVISGLVVPDRGTVVVGGTDVFAAGEAARDRFRARTIGYVHQTFNLLAAYTALENVALAAYFAGGVHGADAGDLLRKVGLADRLQHRPSELSVGQQQRVAVARALVNRPKLLLADEPTGNQDPATARQTLDALRSLANEIEATIICVTHDPKVAETLDRAIELPGSPGEAVA
ncbi:MAG: ABC transporter ATP-binding protein [Planctomycetes bacterium]|jgi:putative ABC transport system ATP-binding protein|nr:ABC transporter ATP-binding protein [Planctomycetota bacterium]MDP6424315.1 ABC transporter ATP-binding protein [Planctomycetota bacterium]